MSLPAMTACLLCYAPFQCLTMQMPPPFILGYSYCQGRPHEISVRFLVVYPFKKKERLYYSDRSVCIVLRLLSERLWLERRSICVGRD